MISVMLFIGLEILPLMIQPAAQEIASPHSKNMIISRRRALDFACTSAFVAVNTYVIPFFSF